MAALDYSQNPPRYPRAIHDQLKTEFASLSGDDRIKALALWAKRFKLPLYGYRPLPQAQKFHRSQSRWRFLVGGNRCLGPETLIESPEDPPRRIADIRGPHRVWAWNGEERVPADAGEPWIKGWEPCRRIHLSTGEWFDCSARHRVLTAHGFVSIESLLPSIPALLMQNARVVAWEPQGSQPIYDFEVPRWHNYVTAGAIHHNSSKSFSLAMETIWAATGLHPWRNYETPNQGFAATTTWDKVGDTLWQPKLEKLLHGIRHETVWHNKQRNIPEMVFVQPKDKLARKLWSQITFKAYEQGRESFQAVALRWIHNDEQFPRDIWVEQNSRIGSEYRLDLASAFTPIDSQPWLEQSLTTSIPSGWDIFELPLDDNRISRGGFIDDDQIDAMIEMWPPEVRETRRRGKWGSFLGAIFQSFSRNMHVVSEARERELFFKDGHGARSFETIGSIDWGGSNPFCFLWAARIPHLDRDWYCFDIYYWDPKQRGNRRLQQHADEIKARTEKWETRLLRCWSDHDPTDAAEFAGMGIPSNRANKGPGSVRAGIELIQTLLNPRQHLSDKNWPAGRPRLHIAARCEDLIRELAIYRWQEGSEKCDAKDEPMKIADHSVDCLKYLCASEEPFSSAPIFVDLGAANRRIF